MRWQPQRQAANAHAGSCPHREARDTAGVVDPQRRVRRRGAEPAVRARHVGLLALALAVTSGCASSGPVDDEPTSLATAASTAPVSTPEQEATAPEDTTSSGGSSSGAGGSTSQQESADTPEQPADGSAGVSIELAGLPVGGGGAVPVGDAWCQVLFWGQQLPTGVSLQIDAVTIREQGAQLRSDGCANAPACQGRVIGPEDSQSCAVLVRPPTPDTPFLTGALNGILNCPDQQTCDAVGATDGSTFRIDNPGGGGTEDGDATGGTGQGSSGDDGDTDEPAGPEDGTDPSEGAGSGEDQGTAGTS